MSNPLYDRLFARHRARDAAFILRPDDDVVTYAAFLRRTAQVAHALRRAGSRGLTQGIVGGVGKKAFKHLGLGGGMMGMDGGAQGIGGHCSLGKG
jgi:hypothetical protein